MSTTGPRTDRAALPRDLIEFLVEFSVALHKHSMYPEGHPALEPAVASVTARAAGLLDERLAVTFGVARRQLVVDGQTTDQHHPLLRRLAEGLHGHQLGALTVMRGLEASEVAEALRALAADPDRDGPLGLRASAAQGKHLHLHSLTLDRLALGSEASTGDPIAAGQAVDGTGSARAEEMWVALARSAILSQEADESTPVSTEPSDIARAIDARHGASADADQAIVTHLADIAHELNAAPAAPVESLRTRTSKMLAALQPETLQRLVAMGGNAAHRAKFVLDAAHGLDVEAVLLVVRAAATIDGRVISNGLVRLMSKLAAHSVSPSERLRSAAEMALRDQVAQLLSGWQLQDPNSERYSRVLERLTQETSDTQLMVPHGAGDTPAAALRVVQLALETGAHGSLVGRCVDRLVAVGDTRSIVELLSSRPPGSDAVADAIAARLVRPANLLSLVEREPIDEASLDELMPFVSAEGFQALLDVLATSENRATRRKLIDRLARAALDTGPYIAARLEDDRWYVLRNMLILMERSGQIPAGFSAMRWTTHQDPRVRCEALRLQLTMPAERERGIRTALADQDPRIVRQGLGALQPECPSVYAAPVAAVAANANLDAEARLLAVNVLGRLRHPIVLTTLLKILDGGRTLFRQPKLAPKSAVMMAALRVVADAWADDPRGADVLKRAQRSGDVQIQQAARGAGV